MSGHRVNYRRVKLHRNYTVEELARVVGVHRNTVREWIKRGLPTIDNGRPTLMLGSIVRAFLEERARRDRRKCQPGQLYCVRCREPRTPAGETADYEPISETVGNLVGICPDCEAMMNRRVSVPRLRTVSGNLAVTIPVPQSRLVDSSRPTTNSDFGP